jgi:mRNA interferase MazF
MTGYKPGDVVLVAYPFEERAGGRRRPVLVVSSPEYNNDTGELVVAQITSRISAPHRPGDYQIQDWKAAKLPRAAMVRSRLATLQSVLVLRRLGELTGRDLQAAMAELNQALGWQ